MGVVIDLEAVGMRGGELPRVRPDPVSLDEIKPMVLERWGHPPADRANVPDDED